MSRTRLKLIIWALLLVLAVAAVLEATSAAANLLASFQRGADPGSALNIVPNVPPDLHVELTWLADDADTGRVLDSFTRDQIGAAYLRSWLQWNLSYLKGEPYGLTTYFSGPALEAASTAVRDAAAQGLRIEQADTAHALQLHLYSADGSVVALTDRSAVVTQIIRDAAGIVFVGETRADYEVVLVLEDGRWRVRHWVRGAASPDTAQRRGLAACEGCVTISQMGGEATLTLDGRAFHVAGINYYPQATPWDAFWAHYNPAIIDRDLTRIKGLGLNTVRIFVPYRQFGGPRVDRVMLGRLADLLDRAHAQQLKVIVTLFDFRADYDLLHWPDADRHLETLLTRFADHPAILAWDLKNEPDLDDARAGQAVVDAWLAHLIEQARRYDSHHLLTIGWSGPAAAQRLAASVDIVQFHYYAPVHEFQAQYSALRAASGEKPLLLGEFGLPTWNSVYPHGHTEAEQAEYYASLLRELRAVNAAGYLAWTLYDVASAPAAVAGRWPWQTGPQKHMGVIRADNSAKPAAALLAPGASLDVPHVPGWARFAKPFWLSVFGLLLATCAGASVIWRRRKRTTTDIP